ncbi:MAG: DUF4234 domain-containing protein [Sandaracinaceae bacterium]
MGPKGDVRSPFLMTLLWPLTLGIYGIWWGFKVCGEVNAFLGTERMSAFKIMALSAVTCGLYGLYYQFVEAKNVIKEVQQKAGLPPKPPFFVGPMQFQGALNKVWETIP